MSDHIDTRDGWREVHDQADDSYDSLSVWHAQSRRWTYWVCEVPVPSLPTAPGYYVSGEGGQYPGGVYRLDEDSEGLIWDDTYGNPHSDDEIRRALPLSPLEPRAVTAKAVLDRVGYVTGLQMGQFAREFGVES